MTSVAPPTSRPRYRADALRAFALALLEKSGVRADIAADFAAVLVDGDLLGHSTHGLAMLPLYLNELANDTMTKDGHYEVVNRRPAVELWDGRRLPGPWLTLRAMERATAMARDCGTGTVVIRRSHHIACLAAYLKRATDAGLVVLIECSDPNVAAVVPHGGLKPYITPNPIAAGIPTSTDPIMLDVSMSITSMGYVWQQHAAGNALPGEWLIDHAGNPTRDPGAIARDPKGSLLPLGGIDAGHKGYALGLLVEALTAGLAGHGRADPLEGWGASVLVQMIDPEAFGGLAALRRQMDHMAKTARASPVRPGADAVRLPGERGLARYREQSVDGVALYPAILPALAEWAQKLDVPMPVSV
jgi:L-lactate dehydrogenase